MRDVLCTICTEVYDSSHDVSALKCGHMFHADCLSPWLNQSMTCPQCRQKVTKAAIIHKVFFSWSDADDSIAGELNASAELSRRQAKLEEAQQKLCLRDRELAKLSAEMSALNDRATQLTEGYRLHVTLMDISDDVISV